MITDISVSELNEEKKQLAEKLKLKSHEAEVQVSGY